MGEKGNSRRCGGCGGFAAGDGWCKRCRPGSVSDAGYGIRRGNFIPGFGSDYARGDGQHPGPFPSQFTLRRETQFGIQREGFGPTKKKGEIKP